MTYSFEKLPELVNLVGKTVHDGWQPTNSDKAKTDVAIHHSLTDEGDSEAFAKYHVGYWSDGKFIGNGWPEIAYHFVILKDGTIEWNHTLDVISYHVGDSNSFAVGICLVGDFRYYEPTEAQKKSLRELHDCLKNCDMPNYKRTRGHDEFPGYAWKACPEFDYEAVINQTEAPPKPEDNKLFRLKTGTFGTALQLANGKVRLLDDYNWVLYELATNLKFNPHYRLITGTIKGKNSAEYYANKIRDEYGWTVYVVPANEK